MTMQTIKKEILPILKKQDVKKAALFGSFARGDNKKNSDVDILIEYKNNNKSLLDFVRLKLTLEKKLKKKVDLVEYSTIHPLLKDKILNNQIPLL